MSCDVGKAMSSAHSPTFPLRHLRHNSLSNHSIALPTSQLCSFSNLSVTSPTSQLIVQSFRRFTYVTAHSPTLPLLHLCHSSFSNPSFAFPTSQAFHLRHLARRPRFTISGKRSFIRKIFLCINNSLYFTLIFVRIVT